MNNLKTKNEDKILVKVKHNLSVLIDPAKVTPQYLEHLKEKYEKCTGKASRDFWF